MSEGGSGRRRSIQTAIWDEMKSRPLATIAALLAIAVVVSGALTNVFGLRDDDGGGGPDDDIVRTADRDGDGVPDARDKCAFTAATTDTNGDGCLDQRKPPPDTGPDDRDGDGVSDLDDNCPDEKPPDDADRDGCPDAAGGYDGLQELVANEDVPEASAETVELAGDVFEDGVTAYVYPDDPDAGSLSIRIGGRYTRMTAVVGIDNRGECEDNRGEARVIDPKSNVLWGPETTTFDGRHKVEADVTGLNRVILAQRPLQSDAAECGGGQAEVAWGQVRFYPATIDVPVEE